MQTSLIGRKIRMFRCVVEPSIGPKPRLAYVPEQMGMEAIKTEEGIYIKVLANGTFQGSEHLVPMTNITTITFEPEPIESVEAIELKRKPGRPVGS